MELGGENPDASGGGRFGKGVDGWQPATLPFGTIRRSIGRFKPVLMEEPTTWITHLRKRERGQETGDSALGSGSVLRHRSWIDPLNSDWGRRQQLSLPDWDLAAVVDRPGVRVVVKGTGRFT